MNTYNDCLYKYLREVSKIKRVSPEEEILLGERIRKGDKEAIRELALANLLFVVHIAKDYQGQGVALADLVSEGNNMLFKITERFDETKGFKFTSFVAPWITAAVLKTISDQKGIAHIPLNKLDLLHKINRASQKFEAENGLPPSVEELASLLSVSEKNVIDTLRVSSHYSSLDASLAQGEGFTLHDVLSDGDLYSPDRQLVYESFKYDVEVLLKRTTNKTNADILRMYFGIGCESLTNLQISTRTGLTQDRVRHLKNEAMTRLRYNWKRKPTTKAKY